MGGRFIIRGFICSIPNCSLFPSEYAVGICVGGVGLARGYLNRQELTRERFIPNTFCDESGSRLYRTGDLARYLSDGNIECLGRVDNQVKIRGYRIEPAEVESVLNKHWAVQESVVVAHEGAFSGERHLVAYVVSTDQPMLSAHALRSFLKDKLPGFMVPSAFILLETLPLLPNGKVERGALPVPENATVKAENVFVGPRTEAEQLVTQIWQEVLKVEKVSIHDNFFDLGGHSRTAISDRATLRRFPDRSPAPLSVRKTYRRRSDPQNRNAQ